MIRPAPYHLIVLGFLGVSSIWGFIGYWGHMFDNFDAIVASGHLPDGRVMRMSYTGVDKLDQQITPVTAFYEVLSNGLSVGPRLLFLNINFLVVCTNVWVMIEARRRGVQNVMLKYPFIFMLLWNFIGAALIQPHYLYLIVQSYRRIPSQDPTVPRHEAIALFLTTIAAVFCPSLLFAPPWLQVDTWTHHGLIGLFHATPIFLAILFFITSTIINSPSLRYLTQSPASTDNNSRNHPDQPWLTRSYILVGMTSAIIHLFTIITALRTHNPDASLIRLFIPTKQRLALANTLPLSWAEPALNVTSTSTMTNNGSSGAKTVQVLEQFHLFSQFDWVVVSLACIVFTHLLLSQARESKPARQETKGGLTGMEDVDRRDLGLLLVGTAVLGPGAAGSFALAVRESRLRERWNRARKVR